MTKKRIRDGNDIALDERQGAWYSAFVIFIDHLRANGGKASDEFAGALQTAMKLDADDPIYTGVVRSLASAADVMTTGNRAALLRELRRKVAEYI